MIYNTFMCFILNIGALPSAHAAATPVGSCRVEWGFIAPSPPITFLAQENKAMLEKRIDMLVDKALVSTTEMEPFSIYTKIVDAQFSADKLTLCFTVSVADMCLPASPLTRLLWKFTLPQLAKQIGLVPVSYPAAATTIPEFSLHYQNAFVIRTVMSQSRGETYFSLHWFRLQTALTRVVSLVFTELLDKLVLKNSRVKKEIDRYDVGIACKLLDIRRDDNSHIVELIAYTELAGVILPVEHALYYLSTVSPQQLAVEIGELVKSPNFVMRYNQTDESIANHTAPTSCLKDDRAVNTLMYWTRTMLVIDTQKDLVTASFEKSQQDLIGQLFLNGISRRNSRYRSGSLYTSRVLPHVCVQIISLQRVSSADMELVYYVTIDHKLVPSSELMELSSLLLIQEIALILGEVVNEDHVVEPYHILSNQSTDTPSAGTEFIVVFMGSYGEADWSKYTDISLQLYFSTCGVNTAQVTIEAHRGQPHPYRRIISVYTGRENYLVLPTRLMTGATTIQPNVLHITSTLPVTVVAVNRNHIAHDSTLILPLENLSREYLAASVWPSGTYSQLAVAAYSKTLVTIALPKQANGQYAKFTLNGTLYTDTISVTLEDMEVLQIQIAGDVTGARVVSDEPVAVFSGGRLYEQITPSSNSGGRYIVVTPITPRSLQPGTLRLVSTQPDTSLSIPAHNQSLYIVKGGQSVHVELTPTDYSLFIFSNRPIKVYQVSKSAPSYEFGDLSLLEVQPISLQSNYYTVTVPSPGYKRFSHYLVIHIYTVYSSGLLLDRSGILISNCTWHVIAFTYPKISMCNIELLPGIYRLWHENPEIRFSAYQFGMGFKESYSLRAPSCPRQYAGRTTSQPTSTIPFTKSTLVEMTPTASGEVLSPIATRHTVRQVHEKNRSTVAVQWVKDRDITTARYAPNLTYHPNNSTAVTSIALMSTSTTNSTATTSNTTTTIATTTTTTLRPASRPITRTLGRATTLPAFTGTAFIPTTLYFTTSTTSISEDSPTDFISSASVDEQYWLQFVADVGPKDLDEENLQIIGDHLLKLFLNLLETSSEVMRLSRSLQNSSVQVMLVDMELLNDYLHRFVFYVMEESNPVNVSHILPVLKDISVGELSQLLNLTVTQPITAYISITNSRATLEEAAAADLSAVSTEDEGTPTWLVLLLALVSVLMVLGSVVAALYIHPSGKSHLSSPWRSGRKQKSKHLQDTGYVLASPSLRQTGEGDITNFNRDNRHQPHPHDITSDCYDITNDCDDITDHKYYNTDTPDKGRLAYQEYPMTLTSEQLDKIISPYLISQAAQKEKFQNKRSLRSKSRNHGGGDKNRSIGIPPSPYPDMSSPLPHIDRLALPGLEDMSNLSVVHEVGRLSTPPFIPPDKIHRSTHQKERFNSRSMRSSHIHRTRSSLREAIPDGLEEGQWNERAIIKRSIHDNRLRKYKMRWSKSSSYKCTQ